jgi:hypothetical protein
MKFGWITAFAVLMIACFTAGASFWCFHAYGVHRMNDENKELGWLRQEFKLSSEQLHRIQQAHSAYQAVCEIHCQDILESRQSLRSATDENASAERIAQLQERVVEVDRACISSIQLHLREIAKIIGGDQGQQYLEEVLPRVADFDHEGPVSLDLSTDDNHAGHLGN